MKAKTVRWCVGHIAAGLWRAETLGQANDASRLLPVSRTVGVCRMQHPEQMQNHE
jgi:hypothetical protein